MKIQRKMNIDKTGKCYYNSVKVKTKIKEKYNAK